MSFVARWDIWFELFRGVWQAQNGDTLMTSAAGWCGGLRREMGGGWRHAPAQQSTAVQNSRKVAFPTRWKTRFKWRQCVGNEKENGSCELLLFSLRVLIRLRM